MPVKVALKEADIKGLDKLKKQMASIANLDCGATLMRACHATIEAASESIVPVDTGALQDSHITKQTGPKTAQMEVGGESAPYAGFVEWGTVKMIAQPFVRPAIDQEGHAFVVAVKTDLENQIKAKI